MAFFRPLAVLIFLVLAPSGSALADDWPAWRGGSQQGTNSTGCGPVTWSGAEDAKWATKIPGRGNSSPIIANDRIYVTTAYLEEEGRITKQTLSFARQMLMILAVVFSAGAITREPQKKAGYFEQALEFIGSIAFGASLVLLVFFEVFGDSALDYERCVIRTWLGSSIVVTLCIAIMSYQLRPGSMPVLLLGMAAVGFGAAIALGVPSRDHAFRGGALAANSGVVLMIAALPATLGTMCIGNFLFSRLAPDRPFLRGLFHLTVAALPVAWGVHFAQQLAIDYIAELNTQVMAGVFPLVCAVMLGTLGVFLFCWGLTAQRSGPWSPRTYRAVAATIAAIAVTVTVTAVALRYAIRGSQYLTYHLADSNWVPQLEWGSPLGITVTCVIPLTMLAALGRRFPSAGIALGRICAGLLALVVFADRNYVSTHEVLTRAIVCTNADNGEIVWTANSLSGPEGPLHKDNSPTTPTAAFFEDRIFAVFSIGVVCCNSDGELQWSNEAVTFESVYGLGASPVVSDGLLIIANLMPDRGYVTAMDCDTGEVRWRYDIADVPMNISGCSRTPCVIDVNGRKNVVVWGHDGVMGLDLHDGQRLWHYAIGGGGGDMVSSVVYDDQRIYCCSQDTIIALDLSMLGSASAPSVWETRGKGPNITSPVLCNGLLLYVTDHGIVTCVDAATGERHWRERVPGNYYASPVATGEYVYFCNRDGVTTVIRASRSFELVATNQHDQETLASFALTQEGVVMRTDTDLLRIDCQKACQANTKTSP